MGMGKGWQSSSIPFGMAILRSKKYFNGLYMCFVMNSFKVHGAELNQELPIRLDTSVEIGINVCAKYWRQDLTLTVVGLKFFPASSGPVSPTNRASPIVASASGYRRGDIFPCGS